MSHSLENDQFEQPTQQLETAQTEARLKDATEARAGTFRYPDAELGGKVHTSVDHPESVQPIAYAEVHRSDGTHETVGTARYTVSGDEARIYPASITARNFGVESSLLSEVGEQARAKGATTLKAFVPDSASDDGQRWLPHGFHPASERNPGAAGIDWERPL